MDNHKHQVISELMASKKIKGKTKDYVVIAGDVLMDVNGQYVIKTSDGRTVSADVVALVHKRELYKLLGDAAEMFWHRKLGMRAVFVEGGRQIIEVK